MTIQVTSTTDPTETAKAEVQKEQVQSAPEAKAPEQKESTESGTEETEAKESETNESEEDVSDEETEAKDSEKDKPKKKGGFQRRIDKLNAAKADAQREAEYWKRVALEKQVAGESKKESVESKTPVTAEGKPNPDHFETHAEYVEALTDWKTEQKLKERDQKLEKSKLETEQEKILKSYTERVESFKKATADFEDVLAEVDDVITSPTVTQIIVESENGPALAYELAKNREEFERINKLPPLAAARELGRIESKIAAKATEEKKPEPKKTTKAPQPITPVGSKGGVVEKSIFDESLSQKEYEALRAKQRSAG